MALIFIMQAWAKAPCPDLASREVARLKMPKAQLFACASRRGLMRDLTVYAQTESGQERLFDGDAVVKAYRLKKLGQSFEIEEGLAGGTFRPFVLIKVTCEDAKCTAQDARCLWRPRKSRARTLAARSGMSDRQWSLIFQRALNGDAPAQLLFEGEGRPEGAEHSEFYSTFRADLQRLKTLGCLNHNP